MGNARISFGRNSAGVLEITDANDYYPFGMNHFKTGNAFFGQGSYKSYKFLGEELQETGFYDLNARFYMPDAVVFGQHDPLSEKTMQPYAYGYNNPIRFIDPAGTQGEDWIRQNGVWRYDEKVTTVEQAQQMRDVDGFAENGTVLSNASVNGGSASAYVQLNEGGSVTKLGADDLASMNAIVDALPMSLGGSWTTWTTETMQSFTGGTNETDAARQVKLYLEINLKQTICLSIF